MKKLIISTSIASLLMLATGCVGVGGPATGAVGSIYTDTTTAMCATSNSGSSKVGTAVSKGVLGFAWGDSSIKTAAANGGITKIQHVDSHVTYVLGVYCETTITVYGE